MKKLLEIEEKMERILRDNLICRREVLVGIQARQHLAENNEKLRELVKEWQYVSGNLE